eukprot:m.1141162 g.1141162  ORF g.1141162 m.1141162 type:complete len:231 (+) comp24449_c0_seq9:834-1526(+)
MVENRVYSQIYLLNPPILPVLPLEHQPLSGVRLMTWKINWTQNLDPHMRRAQQPLRVLKKHHPWCAHPLPVSLGRGYPTLHPYCQQADPTYSIGAAASLNGIDSIFWLCLRFAVSDHDCLVSRSSTLRGITQQLLQCSKMVADLSQIFPQLKHPPTRIFPPTMASNHPLHNFRGNCLWTDACMFVRHQISHGISPPLSSARLEGGLEDSSKRCGCNYETWALVEFLIEPL